jgi:hypothetical protein
MWIRNFNPGCIECVLAGFMHIEVYLPIVLWFGPGTNRKIDGTVREFRDTD